MLIHAQVPPRHFCRLYIKALGAYKWSQFLNVKPSLTWGLCHSGWYFFFTVDITLIPPPPFLADFGDRPKIVFKGNYQISRYHSNSPLFLSEKNVQGRGGGGIYMIKTVFEYDFYVPLVHYFSNFNYNTLFICVRSSDMMCYFFLSLQLKKRRATFF